MGLAERWKGLPRSARWLVIAGVGIGLYMGVVEPLLSSRQASVFAAERAAKKLDSYSLQSGSWEEATRQIESGAKYFGEVWLPSSGRGAESAASNKIRTAMSDRGITEWDIQTARGVPLTRGIPAALFGEENEELQKVTFTVNLTDDPDVVAEVISEIERMPEVTTIGQVQIRRVNSDEGQVQATLTPETWVLVRREERR